MQKKLIALAIAGLSSAAFAQSNVTVYGVADAYYGNFSADGGQKVTGINSGGLAGSRLGFKGVEALGNGLSAVFTLEYGLTIDANTGVGSGTAARQQFVGLTGGFGTAVAGRLQSPGYGASVKFDALAGSVLSPLGQLTDAVNMSISARDVNARFNNAIAYVSPSFGGVTVTAAYSFIGEEATDPKSTGWTLSGDYSNGPIGVNYTHVTLKLGTPAVTASNWVCADPATAAVTASAAACGTGLRTLSAGAVAAASFTTTQKEDFLGASYDFGAAKLMGTWQKMKQDAGAGDTADRRVWGLGVVVPVGAGAVRFAYSKYDDKMAATSNNDANAYSIAYTHSMSKRTTAYAGYTLLDNKGTLAAGLGGATPTAGGNVRAIGLGLNHAF